MKAAERIVSIIAASALAAMMFVAVIDVVGRQAFSKPLHGASEIIEICMMLVTFLLFPVAAYHRTHIKVDLLEYLFSKSVLVFQAILTGVLGGGIFALLAYRLWIAGNRSLGYGEVTMGLEFPIGLLYLAMSVMSAATALAFVASIFVRRPSAEAETESNSVGAV